TDVFVQRWSGFRAADDWQPVGTAPLAVKRLEPGQYRFLAVSPDGTSFAEWNALLLESGREALTVLNVSTDSASGPENASADNVEDRLTGGDANQGQPDLARVLQARFIPTSEVIEGMVYVEPGVYRVSTEQGPTENRELPGVYIDRTEVTNADYQVFVQATGAAEPYYWRFADDFDAIADLPVMWIPFEDAEAYARWQGKRLPTLEEWQAAARGPDRHLYPGGLETPPDVIHGERGHNPETIYTAYIANVVDARVPAEWDDADGLLHLYSNVREKTGTVNLTRRSAIIAGRGWSDPVAQFSLESWGTGPFDFPEPRTGFRCAKSDPATLNEKGMMSE
ncbi:MAG: formylglycine-generating enzyme family protein, partial [Planctomycetota bacterium]